MTSFVPSKITVDSSILQLLESISRKQGELFAHKRHIKDEIKIEGVAAVDAVHFSTKIEGNLLSRDQVTQALQSKNIKAFAHDFKEVLNYSKVRRMVREWSSRRKSFNDEWVLHHHAELLRGIVSGRLKGHYRDAQCVIKDSKSRRITYIAAEAADVALLMRGLLIWLRQQRTAKTSPLLLAAQFHFEFVTIHPFMDGNGRLARLLTNGVLLAGGYDVERYAALEKQHELNRSAYYRAQWSLQSNNFYEIPPSQDIRSWVTYWLKCLSRSYDEALNRVANSRVAEDSIHSSDLDERLQKAASLCRRHEKLRASEYGDLVGLGRTQAVADLNMLVKTGVLERVGGGRSTLYRVRKKYNK